MHQATNKIKIPLLFQFSLSGATAAAASEGGRPKVAQSPPPPPMPPQLGFHEIPQSEQTTPRGCTAAVLHPATRPASIYSPCFILHLSPPYHSLLSSSPFGHLSLC